MPVAIAGGGGTVIPTTIAVQEDKLSAADTTTSTSFVNSSLALTLGAAGSYIVTVDCVAANSDITNATPIQILDGATTRTGVRFTHAANTVSEQHLGQSFTGTLAAQLLTVQFRTNGVGTATLHGTTDRFSQMHTLEINP